VSAGATLYRFASRWEPAPRRTPPDTTLLAIGDVHGCAAHLDAMLVVLAGLIAETRAQGRRCEVVLLGDYVDRGPDSPGVLARLPGLGERMGVPVHLLRGNHDQFLLDMLGANPSHDELGLWCWNGGDTTLAQLGVTADELRDADLSEVAARLRDRLGPAVVEVLERLSLHHRIGNYLFVHAGVHPRRGLELQGIDELLWIREPFLETPTWPHPFAVVHGHTVLGPEVRPHRVGLDSGCFVTGVLTAVELADDRLRFHGVTSDPSLTAFRQMLEPAPGRVFSAPEPVSA
jgi:serine/threonine protein phosphatase 1